MYVIRNGIIVQPDRLLFGYELVVRGDRIDAIQRQGALDAEAEGFGVIDAHGGYVVPGLVDIHSDYIETVISPRPTVLMDFPTALFEAERELLAHGVTTMFHSLSAYGNDKMDVKPVRQWDNTERLMALVDDIIELSRLEEETAAPETERVDLYALAEETLASLRPAAERRDVTLTLRGGEAVVQGVRTALQELAYNLCDNAVKYNRPGGKARR